MTKARVVLRERAVRDLEDVVDRYVGDASDEVALRFVASWEAVVDLLSSFPESGSRSIGMDLGLDEVRHVSVRGFPYVVFHQVVGTTVEAWRVLHQRRDASESLDPGQARPD